MIDIIKQLEVKIRQACFEINEDCDVSKVYLRMRNDSKTGEAFLHTNAAFILFEALNEQD